MYIYTQLIYLIYVSITVGLINAFAPDQFLPARCYASAGNSAVSYTHLTLPTIYSV